MIDTYSTSVTKWLRSSSSNHKPNTTDMASHTANVKVSRHIPKADDFHWSFQNNCPCPFPSIVSGGCGVYCRL